MMIWILITEGVKWKHLKSGLQTSLIAIVILATLNKKYFKSIFRIEMFESLLHFHIEIIL